ncbi:hypothetical protein M2S00_03845 [Apilactobacillus sp. TMW 2.2459]|uniref:hypothetical protein n=1 Tax=Apilactobacillus xinyiensis TaxID=2841032 RepID=UPI00200BF2DB|nr:hypothetical protein [Apilactobacillus xinyiensis]MCL0312232.1 hypothetical protein [Apilactobacillus xinyiensis]MCL0319361.1 hypothetical protein [Apilactobacillus xinyiensis]
MKIERLGYKFNLPDNVQCLTDSNKIVVMDNSYNVLYLVIELGNTVKFTKNDNFQISVEEIDFKKYKIFSSEMG